MEKPRNTASSVHSRSGASAKHTPYVVKQTYAMRRPLLYAREEQAGRAIEQSHRAACKLGRRELHSGTSEVLVEHMPRQAHGLSAGGLNSKQPYNAIAFLLLGSRQQIATPLAPCTSRDVVRGEVQVTRNRSLLGE